VQVNRGAALSEKIGFEANGRSRDGDVKSPLQDGEVVRWVGGVIGEGGRDSERVELKRGCLLGTVTQM
jgi:hypothetical protein